jgi:hypothetical protein
MNYQAALQSLLDASGKVETAINSNGGNPPTAGQSAMLNFCQDLLKDAIAAAQSDPDLPQQF